MSQLDQLLYTWAARGPKGRSGFQVVGATRRLADERSSLTQAALRLCRYVPPRGMHDPAEMPVSYGWIDVGTVRLVFNRVYLGRDALGRPGNFCAHIVAGPREELSTQDIACRIGSQFWWRGTGLAEYEAGTRSLGTIRIGDITPSMLPSPEPETLAALTEALMIPGSRLPWLLRCSAEQIASMIATMDRRLPGVLERTPFSTYEAPSTATDFHIVGVAGPQAPPNATVVPSRPHPSCPASIRRARSLVLSDIPEERDVVVLALSAGTASDGSVSVGRIVKLVSLFDRLGSGRRVEVDALIPALSRPQSATILLRMPAAMEVLVDALVKGESPLWEIVGSVAQLLPSGVLAELGRAVGSHAANAGALEPLGWILLAAGRLPSAFSSTCDEVVLSKIDAYPELAQRIGAVPRLRLLLRASAGHHGLRAVDALLSDPEDYLSISDAYGLPVEWRARVLASQLARNPQLVSDVARRLRSDHTLMGPLAAALPRNGLLISVLSRMSVRQAEQLITSARDSLTREKQYELVEWLTPQLPVLEHTRFVAQFSQLLENRATDARWGEFLANLIYISISESLRISDTSTIGSTQMMALLKSASDSRTTAWNHLICHLFVGRSGGQSSLTAAWIDSSLAAMSQITEPAHHSKALDLVLFVALTKRASAEELRLMVTSVAQHVPGGTSDAVLLTLTAAHRVIVPTGNEGCLVPCLILIAKLVEERGIKTWPSGSLRSRRAQNLAGVLAAQLTDHEQASLRMRINQIGNYATRWWLSINDSPGLLRRLTYLS